MTKIGEMLASVTVLFALALAQKVNPAFECGEYSESDSLPETRKKRDVNFGASSTDFFEKFYVAREDSQIPEEYRRYVNIDFYGNVIIHLFNGVEVNMIVPKGSELQFMAYVDEGRFQKCVTENSNFFQFTVSQPGICAADFFHRDNTFKFTLNSIKNEPAGYAQYKRTVETDDINVRLSNYKLLVWDPVYPSKGFVSVDGCNFQRNVFDAEREIVRLVISSSRACECGAFISFNKDLSIAFANDERPTTSKEGYKIQLKPRLPLSYSLPLHLMVEHNTIIGKTLILEAVITDDVPEFQIGFLCKAVDLNDPSSAGDTPLLVDARYDRESNIVIGSRNRGASEWNEEHRVSNPYSKDSRVHMKVRFVENEVQIIIDGEIVDTYTPFVDPRCIDHIHFDQTHKNMRVEDFRLTGDLYTFPSMFYFPDGALRIGEDLVVVVRTNDRYAMELYDPAAGSDIAFHMSVRTADYLVILNSFHGGEWQKEEEISYKKFPKGKYVEITIKNQLDGLWIKTDAGADYLFHHRVSKPGEAYRKLRFPGSEDDTDANIALVELKQFR